MLNIEEPLLIYTDTRKALHRLRVRILIIGLPIALFIFLLRSLPSIHLDAFARFMPWFLLIEIVVLYGLVSRSLKKQSKPIVSLSSQGITIHTLCTQVGFLRWDEIKEVRTFNLLFRFVGISLNHPKTVYQRLGLKRSWLMRMNGFVASVYNLFRIHLAPINIPQEYLPMSADELQAKIDSYRITFS